MRKIACSFVGIMIALVMVACAPSESENPLSDPKTATVDTRLEGLWVGAMDQGVAYLHFAAKEAGAMDLVIVVCQPKEGADLLQFEFSSTALGDSSYMNLRERTSTSMNGNKGELSPTYIFAKYDLAPDGTLSISYLDDDLVKSAIEAGAITGNDKGGLTAPTEKLAAFVKSADPAKLFVSFGHFKRVKVDLPAPAPVAGKS
jgi:hypothetical protein